MRASASPTRPPPACRSRARPSARWSTASWPCPKARGSICWRRSCAAARANTARSCRNCRSGLPARQGRRQALRDRRGAGARQEAQARYRGRGRPHRGRADLGNALADSIETALSLADGLAIAENADNGRAHRLLGANSPARSRASPSTEIEPGCSRSTALTAPARPATGWA